MQDIRIYNLKKIFNTYLHPFERVDSRIFKID